MSTSTIAPARKADTKFDSVCDAIRDVHDEASLWRLSDELVKIAPNGVASVEAVVAQAKARGIPTKSTNTLRLYRDVAIRFPQAERVPLVSFSAHREAIAVGDVKQARQVLEDLAAKHGPAGVTVTTVKQAIGAATGKVAAVKSAAVKQSEYADVARDLCTGGKRFVGELDAMLAINGVTLDGLHAGLSTVLSEVETRRAKAARRAARKPAASPAPAKQGPANRKPTRPARPAKPSTNGAANGKVGDLRDL